MKLVIVYNANEGLLAGAMDSLHKLFAPASYPCKLCALTYGLLSMRGEWRRFLDGVGLRRSSTTAPISARHFRPPPIGPCR